MNRFDALLDALHLTQWQLVRPTSLRGEGQLRIGAPVKLILVAAQSPFEWAWVQDVLRALQFTPENCLWLEPNQLHRLVTSAPVLLWQLETPLDAETLQLDCDAQFAQQWQFNAQDLNNSAQKRAFWQQIQDFLADSAKQENANVDN